MCWWFIGHCWHNVEKSERKVPYIRPKCQFHNGFFRFDSKGTYVLVFSKTTCCKCKKTIWHDTKEYDIAKAMNYPTFEEENDESRDYGQCGIYWG